MKILVVTQQKIPHSGGLSTHVEILMDALKNAGHEAHLIQGGAAQPSKLSKLFCLLTAFGNKDLYISRNFKAVLKRIKGMVEQELSSFRPDVIHTHDVYASYAVLDAVKNKNVPVVQTVHGPALYEAQMGGVDKLPAYKQVIIDCETAAFKKVKYFIAVDTGQADILVNDYGVSRDKISVIFNCVNVEEVKELSVTNAELPVSGPFMLVPRRLVEKTGVRYAVEAMSLLKDKKSQLVIAGQGPLRADLEKLAEQLNVTDRVKFLGAVPRPQLLPLFAKAKCVIVPSVPASGVVEATSLAVTEAMAAETVPVASGIGGLAELIENDVTGVLVQPADARALASAIDKLLEDDAYRNGIIKNATLKVDKDYSSHAWLRKVTGIYQQLAK